MKRDAAEAYAQNIDALCTETSAKEDTNVTNLFEQIARRLAPEEGEVDYADGGRGTGQLYLDEQRRGGSREGACC